ncbi:MAG TPA: hypothetical protein VK698_38065 [Kofleriaceae bacterium]|nr:hypothetical protein [Kofleriaceae bacterium]
MSRAPLAIVLGVLLLLLPSSCEQGEQEQQKAPVAAGQPSAPPAPATTPTPEPASIAPTAPAAAPPAAPQASADEKGAPVALTSLVGHVGFDWTGATKARCRKLDEKMARKLTAGGGQCRPRDPAEAFSEGAGPWFSCKAGASEWLLYSTEKICRDQLETMEANGP